MHIHIYIHTHTFLSLPLSRLILIISRIFNCSMGTLSCGVWDLIP